MTEVATDVNAGNRRRLPVWMLQVNAAEKVKKSASAEENRSLVAEETESQAAGSKIKPDVKKRGKSPTKEAKSRQKVESLQGCESRRRSKTETRRDDGPKASFTACRGAKKKLKRKTMEDKTVNRSCTTRKQHVKGKKPRNIEEEVASPERNDEEISLTAEDLLCIAKEYVSADKEKQCEQQAAREIFSKSKTSSLSMSSKDGMGGSFQAGGSSQMLSKCSSSSRSSNLIENKGEERENNKDENVATSITSTGDAAQDMLNLYLGPFLMKSPCVETSVRTIESEDLASVRTIESKVLPSINELNKQVGTCAISKEEAPLLKKRSSLKDKVAMFLD